MKLLGRNKKNVEAEKPKDAAKPAKKDEAKAKSPAEKKKGGFMLPYEKEPRKRPSFFGRRKKKKSGFLLPHEKEVVKAAKEDLDAHPAPVEEVKTPTAEPKPEPMKDIVEEKKEEHPSSPVAQPKQDAPVVPETVHSDSNEGQDDESQTGDKPQPPTPRTEDAPAPEERSPRNAKEEEEEEPKEKGEDEGPQEPEGRNEEAEGEPAEKNHAAVSREGSERTDNSKLSIEEPQEETTGLLCGCI